MYDTDKSGGIDLTELKTWMVKLGRFYQLGTLKEIIGEAELAEYTYIADSTASHKPEQREKRGAISYYAFDHEMLDKKACILKEIVSLEIGK